MGNEIRGAFLPPSEVHEVDIEPTTGALAMSGCPASRVEYFLKGTGPSEYCDASGLHRLDAVDIPVGNQRARSRRERDRGFMSWIREHF
jgi:hypothetical protein